MRRSRYDSMADMIREASLDPANGKVKSNMMYGAGLSYGQSEKFLKELLDRKLVEPVNTERHIRYKPTKKGHKFVKTLDDLKQLLKPEN